MLFPGRWKGISHSFLYPFQFSLLMTLHFNHNLAQALENINYSGESHQFLIHNTEKERDVHSSCGIVEKYGDVKHKVVNLINEKYGTILANKFDLYNWILQNQEDEVAYFINEAGSNCLSYSQLKAPHMFHLWLGSKGFIIGIEQKGNGFNAEKIHHKKIKENKGAAFEFFRSCRNRIFFDDSNNAKMVLMEFLLE